jgi:Mrp family chromosome partitioning ATPase
VESIQRLAEPTRLQRLLAREDSPIDLNRGRMQSVSLDRAALSKKPVVLPEETSVAASGYRMLRAQLLRQRRDHAVRAIGIVSAVDGEGKTLTAVNLALSLAADPNQTVLLVDLDLRRPSIARVLELAVPRGLEAWFAGNATDDEVCYAVEGMERLIIVPTLAAVPGSSEALASVRAQQMLTDLKGEKTNRLLIVDLPPVLLTDDFLTIAPLLDGVVLVAKEGYTKRDDLQRVRDLLGPTRLLGTVLNHSAQSEKRAY